MGDVAPEVFAAVGREERENKRGVGDWAEYGGRAQLEEGLFAALLVLEPEVDIRGRVGGNVGRVFARGKGGVVSSG